MSGEGVAPSIMASSESTIDMKISVAPGAPVGRRDLRVITPEGSFVQIFEVGSLPEETEAEPNDDWREAPRIEFPIVINGQVPSEDYDHFRIEARAGQVITFDLSSARVGTLFDAVLSLMDDQGNEVGHQDDYYFDKDPRLVHRFDAAGEYVLRVTWFREAGSDTAEYRLVIGDMPSLSHAFPAGGRYGETVEIDLAGVNLDGLDGLMLDHNVAKTKVLERSADRVKVQMAIPRSLAPGRYSLGAVSDGAEMPNPLVFSVSNLPEMSVERHKPTAIKTPVAINGIIDRPGVKDTFEIDVRAGETYSFDAEGMRLGNFLDPAILVYDSEGVLLTFMDESAPNCFGKEPPSVDFHLVQTFERAGRYRVVLRDAGKRGRPEFVYRLTVRRAAPSFELTVLTNQTSVSQGQSTSLLARVRRLDGWDTPVDVWIDQLPEGVKSERVTAEPENTRYRGVFGEDFFLDGTNVDLPLAVDPAAPANAWPLVIRARGEKGGNVVEHTAKVVYPWKKTGYIRGLTREQLILLTTTESGATENPEAEQAVASK